jgi:AraC-like DNA-binding protein/quercetin dioxygenase-like cupin family protein
MSISSSLSYTDVTKRETKSHGAVTFPVACYAVDFPEVSVSWHWHSELELIRVEKGRLRLHVGARQFVLNEGEGAFINADILHTAGAADEKQGALIHSIVFHPRLIGGIEDSIYWEKFLHPLINHVEYSVQLLSRTIDWQKDILNRIEHAWIAIAEELHGYEFLVRNELSEILLQLGDHQQLEMISLPQKVRRNEQRMKQMLKYIQDHYFELILLEDIAESATVSKSECLRCFREIHGTTPLRYVNQYRLLVAAQNLAETDWQISEIGYGCGFTEMGYFAAQFKKKYGVTPTEYRNRAKMSIDI